MTIKFGKIITLLIIATFVLLNSCGQPKEDEIERKISALISQMTLEEKIGQLSQPVLNEITDSVDQMIIDGKVGSFCSFSREHYTPAQRNRLQKVAIEESRLGIPILFTFDVIHGFSTIYPVSLGLSCSWDTTLASDVASMAAREARGYGIDMTFSPMVDVSRDPRWGRIAECYGEDVHLNEAFGAATVRGYQGSDLTNHDNIGSCVKHFVGYGLSLGGRDKQFTEISQRALLDTYLPPFKACIDAGAVSVMTAFNDISGVPSTANHYTITDVLKDDWGFKGFTLSDWDAVIELIPHGIAGTEKEAAEKAINAGTDMEMKSKSYWELLSSVKEGKVKMETIDESVRRVLRVKFQLGLFDNPYINDMRSEALQLTNANRALARKAGAESMVLLKNNGVLPLSKNIEKLALKGPFASNNDLLGWWKGKGDKEDVVTVDKGIGNTVNSSCEIVQGKGDQAPTTIICVGEKGNWFGETNCMSHLNLQDEQIELVKSTKKQGGKVIVVIFNGRPLALTSIMEYADAVLLAWHPGTEAGNAVADVLFGDVNPSGKLTCTFPKSSGQIPLFYSDRTSGRPDEDFYKDIDAEPLFPFGYGLSYTTFEYSNLRLKSQKMSVDGKLSVSVDVTNTGKVDGKEVVQLYVHDKVASVTRPQKQLVGFTKIHLKQGETKTVDFELSAEDLAFYNIKNECVIEPGDYDLWIGGSSVVNLKSAFSLIDNE